MNYLKRKNVFQFFVVILLACSCCYSTTVVFSVTPYGLLVGTESGELPTYVGSFAGTKRTGPSVEKAIIIQHRLVVTSLNLADAEITQAGKPNYVFRYHFKTWIAAIEKKCPKDVSAYALTSLIEGESRTTFKDFDKFIAGRAFNRNTTPNPFIEYYVAGYQTATPVITRIYFKIDWDKHRLVGPSVERIHPDHDPRVNFAFLVAGRNEVGTQMQDKKSDAYKEMSRMIPQELPKLLSEQDLTLSEATNACLAVLRYETNHQKPLVAPPYAILTIPPLGMGSVTRSIYAH